jgi:hypothetical protein
VVYRSRRRIHDVRHTHTGFRRNRRLLVHRLPVASPKLASAGVEHGLKTIASNKRVHEGRAIAAHVAAATVKTRVSFLAISLGIPHRKPCTPPPRTYCRSRSPGPALPRNSKRPILPSPTVQVRGRLDVLPQPVAPIPVGDRIVLGQKRIEHDRRSHRIRDDRWGQSLALQWVWLGPVEKGLGSP